LLQQIDGQFVPHVFFVAENDGRSILQLGRASAHMFIEGSWVLISFILLGRKNKRYIVYFKSAEDIGGLS